MGFMFRKIFIITPGIKLNIGRKSAGFCIAGKGVTYSVNSQRGRSVTATIPGTAISYTTSGITRTYCRQTYRRQNEINNMKRLYIKMQRFLRTKYEVELYENYIEMIVTIHKEGLDIIDWNDLESKNAPFKKGKMGPKESSAHHVAEKYKPSLLDKIFKRVDRKREQLSIQIANGKLEDEESYKIWEDSISLAKRINSHNGKAYLQIIKAINPFKDIDEFGCGFQYEVLEESNTVVVQFSVNANNVIPNKEKTLTKTGKFSVGEMTKTKFYELYQYYVCSCVIRIAKDLFAIIPVNEVIIHVMDELINSSTGYLEKQTILSVRITRKEFDTLNLAHIDCSDALRNFEHNMRFVKLSGFKAVSQIVNE